MAAGAIEARIRCGLWRTRSNARNSNSSPQKASYLLVSNRPRVEVIYPSGPLHLAASGLNRQLPTPGANQDRWISVSLILSGFQIREPPRHLRGRSVSPHEISVPRTSVGQNRSPAL